MPEDLGYCDRIFQDHHGTFYILGNYGRLARLAMDGTVDGALLDLDVGGHKVEYSGYGISAPRTGTRRRDVLDVVFPTSSERGWAYFQLRFP